MKVIDLSHPIHGSMPFYPGTAPPSVEESATIARDGFAEKRLTLLTHTGTHLDAPAHILQGAPSLDQIPAGRFIGPAVLIDLTGFPGRTIGPPELEPYRRDISGCGYVILYTGWGRLWGSEEYFCGYPALSPEGARWVCGFGLKGLGVDTISVDTFGAVGYPIHEILLGSGLVLVENLAGLEGIPERKFTFCCFPLKILGADGAPARAAAIIGP